MGWGRWLAIGAIRGTGSASQELSRAIAESSQRNTMRRGTRIARRGILGPGDPDPQPGFDYFDYRGVARPKDVAPHAGGPFRLGQVMHPRKGPQNPIGLHTDHLRKHAAVLGPSGAGKSTSIVVPWIATALREGASVVAIDVAGDLLEQVLNQRRFSGELHAQVAKWDFSDPTRSVSWNWLAELQDEDSVVAAVEALIGRTPPNDPQPFFAQRDRRVLRSIIEAVLHAESVPRSETLIRAARDQHFLRRLALLAPRAAPALVEVLALTPMDFSRAMSGVVNALDVLDHRAVRQVTSSRPRRQSIQIADLDATPSLLVVGSPLHGSRTSISTSALLLSQVIRHLYRRYSQSSRQVFLVLDEAARLTDRIDYEELLSVSRRAGVTCVLALQSVTQFANKEERRTILDNCSTLVSLPGPSQENAHYVMSRLGQRQQSTIGVNSSAEHIGVTRQYSLHSSLVPVLGEREIMHPPFGPLAAVVHSREVSTAPFLTDLTRWELVR